MKKRKLFALLLSMIAVLSISLQAAAAPISVVNPDAVYWNGKEVKTIYVNGNRVAYTHEHTESCYHTHVDGECYSQVQTGTHHHTGNRYGGGCYTVPSEKWGRCTDGSCSLCNAEPQGYMHAKWHADNGQPVEWIQAYTTGCGMSDGQAIYSTVQTCPLNEGDITCTLPVNKLIWQ